MEPEVIAGSGTHDELRGRDAPATDFVERCSAMVSMDLVGYSTMVSKNLHETARAIKNFNDAVIMPALSDLGGQLISRAGDSWLMEFAQPSDAVRFARLIQALTAQDTSLSLRTGIHFGKIIDDGSTVHGDAITIAVRLQSIAQAGGITISAEVFQQLPEELRHSIREIGPRLVKNIPEPVWVYRFMAESDGESVRPFTTPFEVDLSHPVPGLEDRPAVAVLPFENAGSDFEHEFFSDGLTEDVINGLSRIRWLPVISRNSTFQYKHNFADIREIGSQLHARYIVGGSVHVSAVRLQVKVWVAEAERRRLLWSERFDREPSDLFAIREDIARGIVSVVEPEFSRAEQFRSRERPLERLNEWELVRRSLWHMNRLTRADALIARELLEKALAGNPDSVEALIHFAWWHFWHGWTRRGPTEDFVEMARLSRRAFQLDCQDARPIMLMGIAEFLQAETERGRRLLLQAIQMNPSLALAHASVGSTYILTGEPELAIEPLQTALRLSPNDFHIFHTLGEVAVARYMMGDFGIAASAAEESLQMRSGYIHAHVVRIGSFARAGRLPEAQRALQEFLHRRPDFRLSRLEWLPFVDRYWISYLAEGLELAGYRKWRPEQVA
jgi:TolB-like protein/class 3 adenylate cyclase